MVYGVSRERTESGVDSPEKSAGEVKRRSRPGSNLEEHLRRGLELFFRVVMGKVYASMAWDGYLIGPGVYQRQRKLDHVRMWLGAFHGPPVFFLLTVHQHASPQGIYPVAAPRLRRSAPLNISYQCQRMIVRNHAFRHPHNGAGKSEHGPGPRGTAPCAFP